MSALALKLIAVVTMFIDHMTASCFHLWGIGSIRLEFLNGMTLYTLGRTIGRIAFPIYCFQIVEGVRYTKNWRKYALRLGLLALLSELPFDFCLHGLGLSWMSAGSAGQMWEQFTDRLDWGHQNVYFTLLLGLLAVQYLKFTREKADGFLARRKRIGAGKTAGGKDAEKRSGSANLSVMTAGIACLRYASYAVLVFGLGYLAKYRLHTDYGMGGVTMIAVMGLINEHWEDVLPYASERLTRVVFCALGLWACCRILQSGLEYYGMFALLPIALYSGRKGYEGKAVQYGFYAFYPLHLTLLGLLAAFAR